MRSATIVRSALVALSLAMLSLSAQAQTVYTSLSTWEAAAGNNWQFTTSFQNITSDSYFQTAPLNVGPFTLQQVGQDSVYGLFQNFIDVPPLQFTDNSGTTNAALYTKFGVTTVKLTFAAPVYAWGANFYGAETGELENAVLANSSGGTIATVPVTVNNGFFGFVLSSSVGVSSITFSSQIDNPIASIGQGFGLENVIGAYLSGPTVTVPSTQVATTASGLAYSRVSQTFVGTATITNVSASSVAGPFQDVFSSLPTGVTMTNSSGTYQSNPFVTFSTTPLAAAATATASVRFSNPSYSTVTATPVIYAGVFN